MLVNNGPLSKHPFLSIKVMLGFLLEWHCKREVSCSSRLLHSGLALWLGGLPIKLSRPQAQSTSSLGHIAASALPDNNLSAALFLETPYDPGLPSQSPASLSAHTELSCKIPSLVTAITPSAGPCMAYLYPAWDPLLHIRAASCWLTTLFALQRASCFLISDCRPALTWTITQTSLLFSGINCISFPTKSDLWSWGELGPPLWVFSLYP